MPILTRRPDAPVHLHDPLQNAGYLPFLRNIVRRHGTPVDRAMLEKFAKATYGAESETESAANDRLYQLEIQMLEPICDRIRDETPVTEPVIF